MARTDEPTLVPTTTSVIQNTQLSRPATGPVTIAPFSTDTRGQGGGDRSTGPGDGTATTGISAATIATTPVEDAPLPVKKAESPKPLKSGGVLNGKAVSLPLPVYSAAAQAVNAQGRVTVQVTVDESGHVISAAAVDGNVLLRRAAEDAARKARFTPTYLSKVPVKVTGVIVYNFNRG
jgi:TonB family protein